MEGGGTYVFERIGSVVLPNGNFTLVNYLFRLFLIVRHGSNLLRNCSSSSNDESGHRITRGLTINVDLRGRQ